MNITDSKYTYYFTDRTKQTFLLLDISRFQCIKNDLIRSVILGLIKLIYIYKTDLCNYCLNAFKIRLLLYF